jgi:RNase P subunit RPR2
MKGQLAEADRGMGFEKLPLNSEGSKVKTDSWYLCAVCQTCNQLIPIMEIQIDARGDGIFAFQDIACQSCGAKHDYQIKSLPKLQTASTHKPN